MGYDALSNAIIKLRKALGDKARKPRIIETIAKTGYRLIAEVRMPSEKPAGQSESPGDLAPPVKPSIAVLPFDNMSGDAEQEYFSDGITEDSITELSRFHDLIVIARHSSFVFQGQALDIAEIGNKLGVQYICRGERAKIRLASTYLGPVD